MHREKGQGERERVAQRRPPIFTSRELGMQDGQGQWGEHTRHRGQEQQGERGPAQTAHQPGG